jgi:hypothetical protein
MNERIKELAAQAGLDAKEIRDDESLTLYAFEEFDIERFAELVRQDEREACEKISDDMAEDVVRFEFNQIIALNCCAEAIRARGEQA